MVIRNFRSDDMVAYVQLVNETDKADKLDKATSVERVKERFKKPGYYPEEDLFFAELDGLLIGYADTVRELEIGRVILDGAVHPAYRSRGVGSELLKNTINQSHNLGAKVVQIPVAQRLATANHFVRRRGFKVVRRHCQMCLTEYKEKVPQIPYGFELHHFATGDEEGLCNLQNLAFADSWGFRPNTVEEIRHLVNTSGCQPEGILFINEGRRKVGYCWTRTHPVEMEKGYIRMIGVAPRYRAQGLARVILLAAIDYLRKRGIKTIELTVDSKNLRAIRLYQSLGFTAEGTILWYQKELSPD